jgi:hypothetical protein
MVVLTLIFVVLYGAALFGWLKPLADDRMVMRLEPIIFAIIGYYFGRLPGQQNEKTLKDEIGRQTKRAEAAQSAKEQALQSTEALEEKIKNVRLVLSSDSTPSATTSGAGLSAMRPIAPAENLSHVVGAAVRILDS